MAAIIAPALRVLFDLENRFLQDLAALPRL
jgi:hypothetical protein